MSDNDEKQKNATVAKLIKEFDERNKKTEACNRPDKLDDKFKKVLQSLEKLDKVVKTAPYEKKLREVDGKRKAAKSGGCEVGTRSDEAKKAMEEIYKKVEAAGSGFWQSEMDARDDATKLREYARKPLKALQQVALDVHDNKCKEWQQGIIGFRTGHLKGFDREVGDKSKDDDVKLFKKTVTEYLDESEDKNTDLRMVSGMYSGFIHVWAEVLCINV